MKNLNFYVGQQEVIKHKIRESDITKFVDLSGDRNPIHFDKSFASQVNLKGPIAHGMLGVSFISSVIGNKLPGPGALWLSQSLDFLSPARVGDNLTITVKVKSIFELENVLVLETVITKNRGELVTRGTAKVKVLKGTSGEAPSKHDSKKVALVVGGSGGIGSEICRQLSNDGYKIMVSYKNNDLGAANLLEQIRSANGHCESFRSDLSSIEEVETLISTTRNLFGGISHVVFCASATLENRNFKELAWEDFQLQLNVHLRIIFEVAQRVVPIFEENGIGNIIAIGSTITDDPVPNWLPYLTAKNSLLGFMKGLSKELGPKNIRVNVVSPSAVETSLTGNFSERSKLISVEKTPLRKLTVPSDVAETVVFLASSHSSQITGQNLRVNGGVR